MDAAAKSGGIDESRQQLIDTTGPVIGDLLGDSPERPRGGAGEQVPDADAVDGDEGAVNVPV